MVRKYLLTTKESFRVDTVEDAESLNKEFKNDALNNNYELKSFSYTKKQVKSRGEVIDEYVVCTAVKVFNAEKEPDTMLSEIVYIPDEQYRPAIEDDAHDLYAGQEGF